MIKALVALAFIGLNYYVYAQLGTREVIPERQTFEDFPQQIDSWRCPAFQEMDPEAHAILGVTDYVLCDYADPERGTAVNLYVGYHASQVRSYDDGEKVNSIHPPEHCLPGAGWNIIDSSLVPIHSGPLEGLAKRFVIAKGDSRQLVYFWYQSRGRILSKNHEVILYKFLDRALRGRSDGALVRLTTPVLNEDFAAAEDAVLDFAHDMTPLLPPHLPR